MVFVLLALSLVGAISLHSIFVIGTLSLSLCPTLWFPRDFMNYSSSTITSFVVVVVGLCSTGLPIAFIAFVVYEKKEQEIDSILLSLKSFVCKQKSDLCEKLFGSKKHD